MTALARSIVRIAAIAAILTAVLGAPAALAYNDATEVRRIADKLQCPVCQGQSVAESNSQVAVGMKETIANLLAEGRGEDDILRFFEDRYGPGVLRNPPRTGFYSLVWWMPGVAVLLGAAAIYGVLRRRQAPAVDADGPSPDEDEPPFDPELAPYRERLRRDLELGV